MSVGPQNQPDEALVDLLIKQATEGLSAAELRELDVLDGAVASAYLRDFERAAAAISLAGTPPRELPPALYIQLERQAENHFAAQAGGSGGSGAPVTAARGAGVAPGPGISHGGDVARGTDAVPGAAAPRPGAHVLDFKSVREPAVTARQGSRGALFGWLAAAACLVLAIAGWLRAPQPVAPVATVDLTVPPAVVVPKPEPVPPTPAEERDTLLARPDSLKVMLSPTKDPAAAGVTGDVVWDPATQKGFLHFAGLTSNDPQVKQYQIWIFDGERDKRYPVDAGVFDVPADAADVVIPIHASLAIHDAKAFAVTVEKPGGVVVSALGHVVALGKAG